jgi:hypothetical protein
MARFGRSQRRNRWKRSGGEPFPEGRLAHDRRSGGGKVFLTQDGWVGGQTGGWVGNRKMKKIILLEFKRTSDAAEAYFQDMWKVEEK